MNRIVPSKNDLLITLNKLFSFSDFAFRTCSVGGWLQEDGRVDTGDSGDSDKPLGFTHFQPCFDE